MNPASAAKVTPLPNVGEILLWPNAMRSYGFSGCLVFGMAEVLWIAAAPAAPRIPSATKSPIGSGPSAPAATAAAAAAAPNSPLWDVYFGQRFWIASPKSAAVATMYAADPQA